MNPTPWWAAGVGALVGVFLTIVFGWMRRKRHLSTAWSAIHAEMNVCHRTAVDYLRPGTPTMPLYRLPRALYEGSIKTVIEEGDIREDELPLLIDFYSLAEQFDRGLDLAISAQDAKEELRRKQEIERVRVKATHLAEDSYRPAISVVDNKC